MSTSTDTTALDTERAYAAIFRVSCQVCDEVAPAEVDEAQAIAFIAGHQDCAEAARTLDVTLPISMVVVDDDPQGWVSHEAAQAWRRQAEHEGFRGVGYPSEMLGVEGEMSVVVRGTVVPKDWRRHDPFAG